MIVSAGLVVLLLMALLVQVGRLGASGRGAVWAAAAASGLRRAIEGRRAAPSPSRRAFVGAIGVGFLLRLLWVIWATRSPAPFTDPNEYLGIALDFTHGIMPRFAGLDHSAYWPPGYPAVLAPFVGLADRTGWLSPAFAASLVNLVAGTVTVGLTGMLAGRWFGPWARNLAAWLVALCPALIYWTSTAHSETVFTPIFLGVIALSASALDRASPRRWVLVGLLLAAAFLVRSPGVIAFVVPALTIRAGTGAWRGARRATTVVGLSALVLLVPWAVRNGVQVGVWTPSSTNNAAAACFGHHDDAQAAWEPSELTVQQQVDCYGDSPFFDRRLQPRYEQQGQLPPGVELGDPDEAAWYGDAMSQAIGWAVTHPIEEVQLSAEKLWETWAQERRVVDGARNYGDPGWAGRWHEPLGAAADLWLWAVGLLGLLGLALVPVCRRALPIWVPVALYALAIVGGVAEAHYRYPVMPLIAVLAAGFVLRHRISEPA